MDDKDYREPDGIDIWLKHNRAPGESKDETFERCLMPESDFPLGRPILKTIPVNND